MKKRYSVKRKIAIITIVVLIVFTIGFIWINSCMSQQQSSEESHETYDTIKIVLDTVFGEDVVPVTHGAVRKTAHVVEFFMLGAEFALLFIALKTESYRNYAFMLPFGLYVAVIDEGIQVLSERGADVKDIFIDYSGYIVAVAVFTLALAIRRGISRAAKKRGIKQNKV